MSTKALERGLLLLVLLALARHMLLALYVHPFADDFSYAAAGMHTELLERLGREYRLWNGRYFSNILVLRGPLILGWSAGLFLYRAVPMLLIALTWAGAYHVIRAIAPGLERQRALIGALFFVLLYLNAMPDASEGIYWYTGAVSYQLPNALALFVGAHWIRGWRRGTGPWWQLVLVSIAVIVISGSTELHMALMLTGHAVLLIFRRRSTGTWDKGMCWVLAVAVGCAVVVGAAPGNAVRAAHFPQRHMMIGTAWESTLQTGRFIGRWIIGTALVPTSMLFIFWHRAVRRPAPSVLHVLDRRWVLLPPVLVVFISMVLPTWSTGMLGQYRTVNAALFFFLPFWFLAVAVWDVQVLSVRSPWVLTRPRPALVLVAVGLMCFALGRDADVTTDLLTGRSKRYFGAMKERYLRIQDAVAHGDTEVHLDPIADPPRSLSILPLSADPSHWMNRSVARYFGDEDLRIVAGPVR